MDEGKFRLVQVDSLNASSPHRCRAPMARYASPVNLTNPMMMKSPIREIIPAPPQDVAIRIREGRRVRGVQLLVSGKPPVVKQDAGVLKLEDMQM